MRTRGRLRFQRGLVGLVLALSPGPIAAQTSTGRITGIVRDTTAGQVAGVQLQALETDSGRSWDASSDTTGAFNFPALPAGTYRVVVRCTGFKTFSTDGVDLNVHQTARLDITLEVGSVSETIEVTGRSVQIQTDTTDVGFALSSQDALGLPVNGRNFASLILLTPGAVAPNLTGWSTGQRTTSGGRPYINGNRKESNNIQLDGVDANQTTDNLLAYQPSLDTVQEIHVITTSPPAEFGNYQGAVINVTFKSGTNQLHGSVFEFFRHDALNAASWQSGFQPVDPLNPAQKAPLRHDVFGGTIGGPLVQNHLFFFGDFQGTRRHQGRTTSLVTFVPAAMRRGDFSMLLDGPTPQQLYDPLTTRPDPSDPSRFVRDPFPNNQIPRVRINPVAAALFENRFYPEPTLNRPTDNVFDTTTNRLDNDQFDVKIDAKRRTRDDFSVRYSHGLQATAATNSLTILSGSGTRSPFRAGLVQWHRQFSGSLLNEARVGFNRIVLLLDSAIDADVLGALGEAVGIPAANRRGAGLPGISFSGAASTIGTSKVVQNFTANTFQYQDNLLWQHGAHGLKSGLLVLRQQQDVYFSGNNGQLGLFELNGQYTRDLSDPSSIGSSVADFFLGYPRRMARGDFAETWQQRSTIWAGYLQDDWRASKNVTLNLGLRYENRTPLVEIHDRQVNFDLATGHALFAGRDGNSRGLYEGYKRDWQPRAGVAWTPERWHQRLVVRGAYSVSSFLEGTGTNLRLTLNPPFFNEFEYINATPAVLGPSIDNGFDALREKDPLTGTLLRAWDPDLRPARSQQWNVTIERQLARDVILSAAYVGEYGTHLVVPVNADQRPGPNQPRPLDATYPQIAGVILTTSNANQRYDGLQTTARKRFSGGWNVLASYTFSHANSHGRGFFSEGGQTAEPSAYWPDPRNRDAEWGPVPFDVRHNATVAGLWELPCGRGRRWFATAPAWIDALIAGWSIAGIWKAHTGFPITIFAPDQSQTGARSGRPDLVGDPEGPRDVGPGRYWFDPSAFVLPKLGSFGNAGVGVVRGPGLNIVDGSVAKHVVSGRRYLELRVDAFNLFNTPAFEAPDRLITSSTFGQVLSAQLAREIQLSVRLTF
jgi:hypothetical protein